MKKILLFAFILVGLSVNAQPYSIVKNSCQLEVYQGSKLSFNLNIRDLVWSSTATYDFNLEDDNRKYGFDIRKCSNYPTRDSLYRTINRWKLSCYGGSDSAWSLIGNHSTDSTINYLGTDDNNPLIIKTNNTNRIKVMGGGNVGINTNAPTNTLDINGSLRIRGLSTSTTDSILGIRNGVVYQIENPSGGGGNLDSLYSENYDAGTFEPSNPTGLNSVSIGGGNFSSGTYSIAIGYQSMATGEVATCIGITNESSGNASISGGWAMKSKSVGEVSFGIYNTEYTPISISTPEPTDRIFNIGNGISSGVGQSDAFTILKNGKVGIDIDNFETTTSSAKLQVNGRIKAVIPSYANDAAAGVGGLTTGDFYQITGTGVLMVKQ